MIRSILGVVVVLGAIVVGLAAMGGGSDAFTVEATLDDFSIDGDLVAPAGRVRISAVNVGAIPHNVGLRGGPISRNLNPGTSVELDLDELPPGTYQLYCDITDHEVQGMVATLVVTEPE